MARNEKISPFESVAINSYDTALCIIPRQSECNHIEPLRSLYDKGYGRWPPHINLLYPFVAPENLQQAQKQVQACLRNEITGPLSRISLEEAGCFLHRANSTVFLREGKEHEDSPINLIRRTALRGLHQVFTPHVAHLTIGQSRDRTAASIDFLLEKAKLLPSLKFDIQQIAILVREKAPGQMGSSSRMRLWGTIDLFPATSESSTLDEFWIGTNALPTSPPHGSGIDSGNEKVFDEDTGADLPSLLLDVQVGTTYRYNAPSNHWQPCSMIPEEKTPIQLSVSSYNVLTDAEHPPERERDGLLLDTMISHSARADILVLQEVSDEFLSFLLSHNSIRELYPYVSHGPPSQADIGPLPSLRNIVMLSKYGFSWETVPFQRRHKGALVAYFDSMCSGMPGSLPLVVAGVHLTSGLTDGSVAAKKVQMSMLETFLTQKYAWHPWIIAGDFNIATSTRTIDIALQNQSISKATVATLGSIESMMTDMGLSDAWSTARLAATDETHLDDPETLFVGEEGATFDPGNNNLAACSSETSNNRPQRYDRILFRSQDCLRVTSFNHFGLPISEEGIQSVPSDHYGVRTTLEILFALTVESSIEKNSPNRRSILYKRAPDSMTETSSMNTALQAHRMLPTEEHVAQRKSAFTLIKQVILGSANDDESSSFDVPMVIVPVGSYSMGTWTNNSDIDCLCIGSISSKTFFKLARQRIAKAADKAVLLLRRVEASTGTMLELLVNDVYMDLQYCPAAAVVERWSEIPELSSADPVFNLSMLSLRKLKPYRDIVYLQRTLPSLPAFRLAYRCIKLWAVQRGISSSKFGYLSGIHITLMLAWVYKQLSHNQGTVSVPDLVVSFFHHFANYDWHTDILFDTFFHGQQPRYQRTNREPMVILGFHAPNGNVAHTSTIPGLEIVTKELQIADHSLAQDAMTWDKFFHSNAPSLAGRSAGETEFLQAHDRYAQVTIQYWGHSLSRGKSLLGWVESRCLLLVVDINRVLPNLVVRIWPARFTDTTESTQDSDYQGSYFIGLSHHSKSRDSTSKDDKAQAAQALHKAMAKFEDQIRANTTVYDPTQSWVGVSLVKPSHIRNYRFDNREWGDYSPDTDTDSDADEEDESDPEPESLSAPTPRKPAPHSSSIPVSSAKLRPASDVLHRLKWDPNLDSRNYVVGYEDRFLGAKETSLEKWKTEQTDDEFIPQHRILYFKTKTDGTVVWDRKTRVDLVFGSGNSSRELA